MNILLKILRFYIPVFIKKKNLEELFVLTAEAFKCNTPSLKGISFNEMLKMYALFTKNEAGNAMNNGSDIRTIKEQLYQNAFLFGKKIGTLFNIHTMNELMILSKMLYNIIGIDFAGNNEGEITIENCYFTQFYSDKICQIVSSLDEGILAGISGGKQLVFYSRITEGKECCRARLIDKSSIV
jgi:hypothetical protein